MVRDAKNALVRAKQGRPWPKPKKAPRRNAKQRRIRPSPVAGRDVVAARVVRNFDDFPEELVRLLLARARSARPERTPRANQSWHASPQFAAQDQQRVANSWPSRRLGNDRHGAPL